MRNWFADRFWTQMTLLIVCIISFSFALTDLYFMPNQEQHRRAFVSECQQQGGRYVELRYRQYCIIDGVRLQ